MRLTRWARWMAMVCAVTAAMSLVAPSQADALLRFGVDARWIPLADETMELDGDPVDRERQFESTGMGVRGLIGFEYFSVGGKINLARHVFADDEQSYTQLDVNGHIRTGVPLSPLAFYLEAGPSLALDIAGPGYNAVLGAEVDILPRQERVDMNLGVAGQYAYVPVGAGPSSEFVNSGLRGMVTFGVDFTLQ